MTCGINWYPRKITPLFQDRPVRVEVIFRFRHFPYNFNRENPPNLRSPGTGGNFSMISGRLTKSRGKLRFHASRSQPKILSGHKKSTEIWDLYLPKLKKITWEDLQQDSWETPINDTDFLQNSTVTFKKSGSDRTKNYPPTWLVVSTIPFITKSCCVLQANTNKLLD